MSKDAQRYPKERGKGARKHSCPEGDTSGGRAGWFQRGSGSIKALSVAVFERARVVL